MECPACNGKRETFAFINTGPDIAKHRSGFVQCMTCNGVGSITDEHAQRIARGRALRDERVARGELLSERAEYLGLTVPALCDIEFGRERK